MSAARFSDDLYRGSHGGCGQIAFCNEVSWSYRRHSGACSPGKWLVSLVSGQYGDFAELVTPRADAVVDDFGTLVRVARGEVAEVQG